MGGNVFMGMEYEEGRYAVQAEAVAALKEKCRQDQGKLTCIAIEGVFQRNAELESMTLKAEWISHNSYYLEPHLEIDEPWDGSRNEGWKEKAERISEDLKGMVTEEQLPLLARASGCHIEQGLVFETLGPVLLGEECFAQWRAQCEARALDNAAQPAAADSAKRMSL